MKKMFFAAALVLVTAAGLRAQQMVQTPLGLLPTKVYYETGKHHVQGVAVDVKNKCVYFSFTTSLIKTDYQGNLLGSVTGLSCHLGCIDLDPETGKIYGSMEYKDDVIGQGISGASAKQRENTFYIGIFDTDKITRPNIDAATGGVFKAAYLGEVVRMYEEKVVQGGKTLEHRYGCSGIDGVAIGPQFGQTGGRKVLNVAFGIYGDNTRTDNDYQVILQFDPVKLEKTSQPLDKGFHHVGPKKAQKRYFAYTGNTTWGVQNLEYDAYKGYWFMAAYNGKKPQFPNYSLFAIDGGKKALKEQLMGFVPREKGLVVSLAEDGLSDAASGIRGWNFKYGSTGMESLGQGYYYFSQNGKTKQKVQYCNLVLYKWTGRADEPFEEVK